MPYLILALTVLLPALWIIIRRRDAALLATFLVGGGLTMLADWVAHGWFSLYIYRPRLVEDAVADAMLGEFLAETLFVPSLAVLLIPHLPRVWGVALGTALVTAVEALFLRTRLLTHHDWQFWMTAAGFAIYFWCVGAFWYKASSQGVTRGWMHLVSRLGTTVLMNGLLAGLLKGLDAVIFHPKLFADALGNQSLGLFLIHIMIATPSIYWVVVGGRAQLWSRLVALFIAWYGLALGLGWLGIISFRPPNSAMMVGASKALVAYAAYQLDRLILGWSK